MSIQKRYVQVMARAGEAAYRSGRDPEGIRFIVVSKGRPIEDILAAYEAGCRDFGENRLEEASWKIASAPKDIRWHFIGTLQTKKAGKITDDFSLIHSVDTIKLADKLSQSAFRDKKNFRILLQSNTSGEEAKHGSTPDEWQRAAERLSNLQHIQIHGLMTMAPLTQDKGQIRLCFRRLRELKENLEQITGLYLPELSMGMSRDYEIAIEEGATLVRIGSAIFKT